MAGQLLGNAALRGESVDGCEHGEAFHACMQRMAFGRTRFFTFEHGVVPGEEAGSSNTRPVS